MGKELEKLRKELEEEKAMRSNLEVMHLSFIKCEVLFFPSFNSVVGSATNNALK